jgi:gp16 family phage-associated protein
MLPRSLAEARNWFELSGGTVAGWAKAHGFQPAVVYALLSGRTRGRRGEAHRAAVELGLKPKVETEKPTGEASSTEVDRRREGVP